MVHGWRRWIDRGLSRWRPLRRRRFPPPATPLPPERVQALLEAAYRLRDVLRQQHELRDIAVGLERDRVVLLLPPQLPPALQQALQLLQALVGADIELRPDVPRPPVCRAADGDHCNGDYDRE